MENTNSPTAPRRVTTAERKKSALALRIGGLSFQAIGDKLGVTRQAAHSLVVNALRDTNAQTAEAADELRRLELERLDTAQAAIWEAVLKGDVQAVDRFVRISKRRGELTGIDAPAKSEIAGADGGPLTVKVVYDESEPSYSEPTPPASGAVSNASAGEAV